MRVLFFFKQKTAYEMRISDWSSDVCSSDLHPQSGEHAGPCCRRWLFQVFSRVGNAVGFLNVSYDRPVFLVRNWNELGHARKFFTQCCSLHIEAKECFIDFLDQLGIKVVGVCVRRGGETLRLVVDLEVL